MLTIGQKLPDFELEAYQQDSIKNIKLSAYLGHWLILLFYPADFTFVCPTELAEAAHYYPQFQKEDAEICSLSTDSVWVHKAWHDQSPLIKNITFPMLADPTGNFCKECGTYLSKEGISLRATFILDPDGLLKAFEMHDNSIGRSSAEILRKLQAARFTRDHPGAACPASWHPGDQALKPGLDLVGKL